jgi:hypothetical protein
MACELRNDLALSIPLRIVLYTSDDLLNIENFPRLKLLWWWFLARLLEILTQCKYCHAQAFYGNITHGTPYHGISCVKVMNPDYRPWSVQYLLYDVYFHDFPYIPTEISFWKNLRWWWNNYRGRRPRNCIAEVESIMRMMLTKESYYACKLRCKFKSIEQIEESILRGEWGRFLQRLPGDPDPRVCSMAPKEGGFFGVE